MEGIASMPKFEKEKRQLKKIVIWILFLFLLSHHHVISHITVTIVIYTIIIKLIF